MNDKETIERCPFCGSEGEVRYEWQVCCSNCACEGPFANTEAEAIKAWNFRALPTPDSGGDVGQLKAAINRLLYLYDGAWHPDSILMQEYGEDIEGIRKLANTPNAVLQGDEG